MRHKSGLMVLALAATTALAASGCSSSSDTDTYGSGASGSGASGSGAAGNGATGAGGTGNTYVPPTCGQECQDYLVASALNDTIWFIWNQRIAGTPSGPRDDMGPCPLGGEVHVTGSNAVSDNGIDSMDLVIDLDQCENANDYYDLTFTTTLIMEGSFDAETDFAAITFSATSLEISGTLDYFDDPAIDETCEVHLTQQGTGDRWEIGGRLCERLLDEDSLDPNASSGGSSGQGGSTASGGNSSSGGSGSNACTCYCPDGSDCTDSSEPNPCGVDADGIPEVCGCPVDCP